MWGGGGGWVGGGGGGGGGAHEGYASLRTVVSVLLRPREMICALLLGIYKLLIGSNCLP